MQRASIQPATDSVQGVDITVPVYHFAETHYRLDKHARSRGPREDILRSTNTSN